MLKLHTIIARDIPDLWFQSVHDILDYGSRFTVDRGSYAGQTRLEFDYFIGVIRYPAMRQLLPEIPPACGIPNPVEHDYIFGGPAYPRSYMEYLMTDSREPGEAYTYGERLTAAPYDAVFARYPGLDGRDRILLQDDQVWHNPQIVSWKAGNPYINQIELAIYTYQKYGHRNNQMTLQIARPTDMLLQDPPCLRSIDTRIQDGALHFFVYFRSWDLWGGLPANLAGIQVMKEYMASEIGVKDGELIVESKGLHLYGYAERLAELRCMKGIFDDQE